MGDRKWRLKGGDGKKEAKEMLCAVVQREGEEQPALMTYFFLLFLVCLRIEFSQPVTHPHKQHMEEEDQIRCCCLCPTVLSQK